MPEYNNGTKLILDEIEATMAKPRLSAVDKTLLKAAEFKLKYLVDLRNSIDINRERIETLESHDLVGWTMKYPKLSAFVFVVGWMFWSMIKPYITIILFKQVFGIDLPLELAGL